MTQQKTVKFKILCNERQKVKNMLTKIDAKDIKDLNKSTSFDISAKFHITNTISAQDTAEQIFQICGRQVQAIEIMPNT